ncbi:serine protein kinase RIO [archaeon]|jgi:RIO kinase 1|nr:serine protein kinase RIO [archaeon]MBT4397635.1 serine protein kinase RIO [archaeon]MBT4441669.1 serine protein kinase RIO [archaeon]
MSKNKFIAYENVFDESTLKGLFKLRAQGYYDEIKSPIKIGKESNVFSVTYKKEMRIVKVYRTAANFKKMYRYMHPDPRFARVRGTKLTVIYAWARKEYRNLLKAKKVGLNCPVPYAVHKNLVCMEFIGGSEPAKLLYQHKPKKPRVFYNQLIKEVKLLLKAKLVHADLSEFNILNFKEKPVLIDFSHAIDIRYPNYKSLLLRDMENLVRYFNKLGLKLDLDEEMARVLAVN